MVLNTHWTPLRVRVARYMNSLRRIQKAGKKTMKEALNASVGERVS